MRACALLLMATACSFDPRGLDPSDASASDGSPDGVTVPDAAADAAAIDAAAIDAQPIDAQPIDAQPIDAQPIDAQPIDSGPPRCVGYQAVTGAPASSRYRKVNTYTLWVDAAANCTSDGGFLSIPETTAEAVAIYGFVGPEASSPFYWAGISDTQLDGTWTTVLGQTFANPPFASGQPNRRAGEFYVLVSATGLFYDFFDYGIQHYACECVP